MMNFNEAIQRRGTNSIKWDSIEKTYQKKDLLPLWIADMDFKAPLAVQKALATFVSQGIYGYSFAPDSLYESIINWQKNRHNYELTKEEILFNSGVVPSIAAAIHAYSSVGDAILVNDPVYPPFSATVKDAKRTLVRSPLLKMNGQFEFDFDDLEKKMQTHTIKLFILCNPHNPGGRVWTKAELQKIGLLCKQYGVLVVSDEIHQDLILPSYTFHSFQTVDPSFADFSIVLAAPTKTFNLASVKNSMMFIKNKELRKTMLALQHEWRFDEINTFGYIATEAAYREGAQWLDDLLSFLAHQVQIVRDHFKEHLPQVEVMIPQGTYLMWLDFSAFELSDSQLQDILIEKAGVVLNYGYTFGPHGRQHIRLNIACQEEILKEGLTRLTNAFNN